ncbi:MAG TPA: hypothetical protein VIT89_10790 [Solirubrobacterales bacterium]
MAVMARETWTDERLDDLAKRTDRGFDETKVAIRDSRADMGKGFEGAKQEVRDLRADMGRGFEEAKREVRELRADMDKGIDGVKGEVGELRKEMNARFDSMQQTLMICFAGLAGSIVASAIGALLVTQL